MPKTSLTHPKFSAGFKRLPTFRCLLVLAPFVLVFVLTGKQEVLSVAILGGGLFIASENLALGSRLIFLHFFLAFAAFVLLYAALGLAAVFTILVATMAMAVVAATRSSVRLRSFGNWIFIPAVYLACELGDRLDWSARMKLLPSILLYSLLAPVSVGALRILWPGTGSTPSNRSWHDVNEQFHDPNPDWLPQACAAFAAVLLVTGIAEVFQLPNPQWMIWSALSVIALNLKSSRLKIKDRTVGVLVGCPLGFLAGFLVPPNQAACSIAILLILVSLVAFEHYRTAFTLRCAFTAFAAVMAGGSFEIAGERIANVIFGGCIGVIALHFALGHYRKSPAATQ